MNRIETKKVQDKSILLQTTDDLFQPVMKKRSKKKTSHGNHSELDAIDYILDYYRMEKIEKTSDSLSETMIDSVLRQTGLIMRKITLQGKWWASAAIPMIVFDEEGNEYALIPSERGGFKNACAEEEEERYVNAQQAKKFQATAYCFYKPLQMNKVGMKEFWKFMWKSISAKDIGIICMISLFLEVFGLVMPYINSIVFNLIIPSGTARQMPGIIVLIVSTVLISTIIGLQRNIVVARIGTKMRIAGQSAVWNRLFQLPVTFFKKYDSGELYNRTNAINQICDILGGGLIPAALTAFFAMIYLFQIAGFAPDLVWPAVIIILLLLLNIGLTSYFQVQLKRKSNMVSNKVDSMFYQLLNGIVKIRLAAAEVKAFQKWAEIWKKTPVMGNVYIQISSVIGSFISLMGSIVLYALAWKKNVSVSDFIAFETAVSAYTVSVMALADFGFQLGSLKPSIDMIRPILEETPELYGNGENISELKGEIEISNVKFRYTTDMPYVLNGLSLNIQAGEYIGIVGSSGCGKSTLMRILLGFETPEKGTVYYDGKDISKVNLPSLRRRIGVVLQSGSLFSGDIISNLSICAPMLTVDEAWDALEKAGVADDVQAMPMGLYTMLSEDGGGISGGQKQRLLIARAIATNPDILLFDEATSALDNFTQATVVETLKNMECTRLVIAHRLSTIKQCDRIIYLDHGEIIEQGTYEELMELNGAFAQMAYRQLA